LRDGDHRAQTAGGGAAPFAQAPFAGRRRRATAPRAESPRRSPAAPRLALAGASARAGQADDRPGGGVEAPRRRLGGARTGARGAPRTGARHPSRRTLRPWTFGRARGPRGPGAPPGRGTCPGGAIAASRGGRRLLRRLGGADQRGQVRTGIERRRPRHPSERPCRRGGRRRRCGRSRSAERLGPARPRGPCRGPRRAPARRKRTRPRDRRPRGDPMRVVLADDTVLLREGVARILDEAGFEVVGQAGNADELMLKVRSYSPDVAIVDIRMPPTHTDEGLRAAQEIREKHPTCGVLVLSQYVEATYAMELLAESAEGVGYLLKDRVSDVNEFADAVRRVGEGGSALDPTIVSQLVGRRRRDDPIDQLTPREREVLGLMAEGRSNSGIAEQLVVTERAVEKHVTSIFAKLRLPAASEDHRRVLAVLAYLRS